MADPRLADPRVAEPPPVDQRLVGSWIEDPSTAARRRGMPPQDPRPPPGGPGSGLIVDQAAPGWQLPRPDTDRRAATNPSRRRDPALTGLPAIEAPRSPAMPLAPGPVRPFDSARNSDLRSTNPTNPTSPTDPSGPVHPAGTNHPAGTSHPAGATYPADTNHPAGATHLPAHNPGSLVLRSALALPRRPGENTRAVHLPPPPVPSQAPVATPIYRTAAFAFRSSAEYASVLADATPGFSYSRIDNPTVEAFSAAVAALEGVNLSYRVTAQAFASGMAAISTVFWAFTKAGARVLAPAAVYGGSYGFLRSVAAKFGVRTDFVDMTDLGQVRAALRPGTAIVYAETLANPTVAVTDIAGLAALAHEAGALLVVDSTLAPPVICRPLEHGADLVLHSATKYFGGHSDVTGGVVTGHPELIKAVRLTRIDTGGSLASDDAYLLRRGLETLPLRVRRQCATAQVLAASLARHPAVRTAYYPGLAQHPGHQIARRQFDAGPEGTRFGAIVTVAPYGGHEAGLAFADRLRLARTASSLGGTFTKVSHVASTTHRQMDHAALAAAGIDPGSVRFSVGLEDGEDLLADAIAALDSLGRDGR